MSRCLTSAEVIVIAATVNPAMAIGDSPDADGR